MALCELVNLDAYLSQDYSALVNETRDDVLVTLLRYRNEDFDHLPMTGERSFAIRRHCVYQVAKGERAFEILYSFVKDS